MWAGLAESSAVGGRRLYDASDSESWTSADEAEDAEYFHADGATVSSSAAADSGSSGIPPAAPTKGEQQGQQQQEQQGEDGGDLFLLPSLSSLIPAAPPRRVCAASWRPEDEEFLQSLLRPFEAAFAAERDDAAAAPAAVAERQAGTSAAETEEGGGGKRGGAGTVAGSSAAAAIGRTAAAAVGGSKAAATAAGRADRVPAGHAAGFQHQQQRQLHSGQQDDLQAPPAAAADGGGSEAEETEETRAAALASWEIVADDFAKQMEAATARAAGDDAETWDFLFAAVGKEEATSGVPKSFFYPPLPFASTGVAASPSSSASDAGCSPRMGVAEGLNFLSSFYTRQQQAQQTDQQLKEQQQPSSLRFRASPPPPPLIEVPPPTSSYSSSKWTGKTAASPAAAEGTRGSAGILPGLQKECAAEVAGAAAAAPGDGSTTPAAATAATEIAAVQGDASAGDTAAGRGSTADDTQAQATADAIARPQKTAGGSGRAMIRKKWCICDNADVTHFRRKILAVRQERARLLGEEAAALPVATTASPATAAGGTAAAGGGGTAGGGTAGAGGATAEAAEAAGGAGAGAGGAARATEGEEVVGSVEEAAASAATTAATMVLLGALDGGGEAGTELDNSLEDEFIEDFFVGSESENIKRAVEAGGAIDVLYEAPDAFLSPPPPPPPPASAAVAAAPAAGGGTRGTAAGADGEAAASGGGKQRGAEGGSHATQRRRRRSSSSKAWQGSGQEEDGSSSSSGSGRAPVEAAAASVEGEGDMDSALAAWLRAIPREEGDLSPLEVPLAIEFTFPLDEFQKRAILRLEKYQTVFVAAHTSAGKTVVAEYAIALAVRRNRRCIYTSPLKALSNQKYREFKQKFPSVGIITGDVCINPDAGCLIVTTEILRSLLYRGDALIGQADSVIFDEAHYINDLERGVVWEEAIILLPPQINMVLLSATVPNFRQLAEWLGAVRQREVFVLTTNRRPTPLRHYLYVQEKAFLLMDAKDKFQASAYNEAFKHVREKHDSSTRASLSSSSSSSAAAGRGGGAATAGRGGRGGGGGGRGGSGAGGGGGSSKTASAQNKKKLFQTPEAKLKTEVQRLQALISRLDKTGGLPVVVFCFSRRKCEVYAQQMRKLDVVDSHTARSKIHLFIKACLMALSPADRDLPQIRFVCSLVQRGVGVHHGGLLPLLKEMVEILFQRGLVRVLFATETLAIGLNMPARSIIFSALHKYDGQRLRMLLASEYTQMAGRAGRRGIDVYGNVYIFCSEDIPDPKELTSMMVQKADPLLSRFRLSYHTLLLLTARTESLSMTSFLSKSFLEAERVSHIPIFKRNIKRLQKELEELPAVQCIFGEPAIEELVQLEQQSREVAVQMHLKIWKEPSAAAAVFCPGRVVLVHTLHPLLRCSSPALLLGVDYRPLTPSEAPTFTMLVLLPPGISAATLAVAPPKERKSTADQSLRLLAGSENVTTHRFPPVKVLATGRYATAAPPGSRFAEHLAAAAAAEAAAAAGRAGGRGGGGAPASAEGAAAAAVAEGVYHWVALGGVSLLQIETVCDQLVKIPASAAAVATGAAVDIHDHLLLGRLSQELDRLQLPPDADLEGERGSPAWPTGKKKSSSSSSSLTPLSFPKAYKKLELEFISALLTQKDLFYKIRNNQCYNCPLREQHMQLACRRKELETMIKELAQRIDDASLDLWAEMQARLQVLRKLNLLDSNDVLTITGRVACQVMAGDDLTLPLLLFQNTLQNLSPEEIAAVLSAFVFSEGSSTESVPAPTVGVQRFTDQAMQLHKQLLKLQVNCGLRVNAEEWWKLCNFSLSMVAFEWASGVSFGEIMQRTSAQEGSIVRCILRLDELIRKIKQAAVLIGDSGLDQKLQQTSDCIRRDIVFAMSLYLQ